MIVLGVLDLVLPIVFFVFLSLITPTSTRFEPSLAQEIILHLGSLLKDDFLPSTYNSLPNTRDVAKFLKRIQMSHGRHSAYREKDIQREIHIEKIHIKRVTQRAGKFYVQYSTYRQDDCKI